MKRITEMWLRLAVLLMTLCAGIGLWFFCFSESPVECVGDVDWNINHSRFIGTLSMRMDKGEGLAVLNGKLQGATISDVSRSIYFDYIQHAHTRVMQANHVVKTLADTADQAVLEHTLPTFYQRAGEKLSLRIDKYRNAWIFSTSNVPSFYCRRTAQTFSF